MQGFDSEEQQKKSQLPRVCIIGCGVSGITTGKHLLEHCQLEIFEAKDQVGGLWVYQEKTEDDYTKEELEKDVFYQHYKALNCSLYENLQLNSPAPAMALKGMPLDYKRLGTFPKSEAFTEYINEIYEKSGIKPYVRLNTLVEKIRVRENLTQSELEQFLINANEQQKQEIIESPKKYIASYVDIKNPSQKYTQQYDHIIVANGHKCVPNVPKIEGDSEFEGQIRHSHNFRVRHLEQYHQKTVLIYGSLYTAQDILMIMNQSTEFTPKKIIWVGNKTIFENMEENKDHSYKEAIESGNMQVVSGRITKLGQNGQVIIENGKNVLENVDVILHCTGYQHHYPFFEEKDKIIQIFNKETRHNAIGPLYRFMFSAEHPEVIFMAQLDGALTVMYVERQAIVAKDFVRGLINLPSRDQMIEEWDEYVQDCLKDRSDGSNLVRITKKGTSELQYHQQLFELQKTYDEIDEKHNRIVYETIQPRFLKKFLSGNYPQIKQMDFSKLHEEDYCPDPKKF